MGNAAGRSANLVGPRAALDAIDRQHVAMLTAITEEVTKLEGRVDDLTTSA